MNIRLPQIELREVLHRMREHNTDEALALELIGYIYESMPMEANLAVMRYLMNAHEVNGEPWPTTLADLGGVK